MRVLVAGATGLTGRHLVQQLKDAGHTVRTLSRRAGAVAGADEQVQADLTRPATLAGVCDGVDAVISAAGAPLPLDFKLRGSFREVDFEGNRNLLDQAQLSGVRKFVYVSVFGGQKLMEIEYTRAHEHFVLALENSGVPYAVVRPTGFFGTFLEILDQAKRGRGVVAGSGAARTNPIHEADVAAVCVEALAGKAAEIPCGGPDVLTRREITEMAFEAAGRKPSVRQVPPAVPHLAAVALRPFNPRVASLIQFATAVSMRDVVAPARGALRLRDYFAAHAAGTAGERALTQEHAR